MLLFVVNVVCMLLWSLLLLCVAVAVAVVCC